MLSLKGVYLISLGSYSNVDVYEVFLFILKGILMPLSYYLWLELKFSEECGNKLSHFVSCIC